MIQTSVDFSKTTGAVKPLHCVNNGPVYKFTEDQRITNMQWFREAGIPYARTHDASFCSTYGGEHTVDIIAIFPDFDKDPCDPASYDFTLTDEYMKVINYSGTKVFYRLGNKIEHWPKKYGTLPPKDFKKWAVICEHIIAHYTEKWADGFDYDMEYWEIWNEPDLAPDDADLVDKKTWGGTQAQFCELFDITAQHLKKRFPHLKIGGPAICYPRAEWLDPFFAYCRAHHTPLDFLSWHCYAAQPSVLRDAIRYARKALDENGYTETESHCNEWNYVRSFVGEDWLYSLRTEKSLKGASYTASVIAMSQYEPLDMLMYYDARPCAMNGLFSTDFVCDRLKGYYPFYMFNKLYAMGTAVEIDTGDECIYGVAAKGNGKAAVLLSCYQEEETFSEKTVRVQLKNMTFDGATVSMYVLDAEHDCALVRQETLSAKDGAIVLKMPLFATVLLSIE